METKKLQDLGVLSATNPIFVSCLPKETSSVVVKYDFGAAGTPDIRVSCVIPPQTMHVRLNQQCWNRDGKKRIKRCKIKTPTLLMSIKYSDAPSFGRVLVEDISIFAIDAAVKDKVRLKP